MDGVDLAVAPGEVVALLGPNGAGKTTTIEMILGRRRPDSGGVTVFGLDPVAAIRSGRGGAMMQSGGLLRDLTVKETVGLVAAMHAEPMPMPRALDDPTVAMDVESRRAFWSAGRVVADGPASEIKAAVDVRRIRVTLPDADLARLRAFARHHRRRAAGGNHHAHLRRRRRGMARPRPHRAHRPRLRGPRRRPRGR